MKKEKTTIIERGVTKEYVEYLEGEIRTLIKGFRQAVALFHSQYISKRGR